MTSEPMDEETGQRRCTATSKQSGERCKRLPIRGGTVCSMHGGKTPAVRAAADRRLEERQAQLALQSFGLPRAVDPHTALLEELHRTAGAVSWLGAIVAGLDRDGALEGASGDNARAGAVVWGAGTSDARPSTWVTLWQGERKHLVAVSRECLAAGIEERRVRLAEAAGAQLASVLRAVLDRLGLTDEQQVLALEVVPEEFRRLAELTAGESGGAA